ncbi:MAG: ATP-binding cassette domain-containing protein [Bacteroidaceae bacterium]
MIRFENVNFCYNRSHQVLHDFSLELTDGGIYGLLGKNGTGKSTMLYLIMGLLHPQKGRVTVDGTDTALRDPNLLADMFIVPEEYNLPHVSLKQYVDSIAPLYPNFSTDLLERCLRDFEMDAQIHLGNLSMGQKKKVYMCIALAAGTRYLLMDEPTNGLDILSKSQFRKVVISGMTPDKTILISTHQVHDVERLVDHVAIISNNGVLLNEPLMEQDAPIDLEQLFIQTIQSKASQS